MDKITGVSIKALKGRKILTPFLGLISACPPWRRGIQGGLVSCLPAGVNSQICKFANSQIRIFEPKGLIATIIGQRPMDKITGVSIKALKERKILTPFLGLISARPPW